MNKAIYKILVRLAADERGLTAVEYAVLGGIIVAGLVFMGGAFTGELGTAFGKLIP